MKGLNVTPPMGHTHNGKIRHIKNLISQHAQQAHKEYLDDLNTTRYGQGDYFRGKRDGYEMALLLLKELLIGNTHNPEEVDQ